MVDVLNKNRARILAEVPGAEQVVIGTRGGQRKLIVFVRELTPEVGDKVSALKTGLEGIELIAEKAPHI
jgi:hypothetical protein